MDEYSNGNDIFVAKNGPYSFYMPEMSEWSCYLFGNTPETNTGLKYIPQKGKEPNWFVRWMMKICFDCTWVKEKEK